MFLCVFGESWHGVGGGQCSRLTPGFTFRGSRLVMLGIQLGTGLCQDSNLPAALCHRPCYAMLVKGQASKALAIHRRSYEQFHQ